MPPFFKNVELQPTEANIGEYMTELMRQNGDHKLKSRKLIGSLFCEKQLIYTPLLQWMLAHGIVVTKVHSVIKAIKGRPFERFTNDGADGRRMADAKHDKALGEKMKTSRNSSFGRTGMDKERHHDIKYVTEDQYMHAIVQPTIGTAEETHKSGCPYYKHNLEKEVHEESCYDRLRASPRAKCTCGDEFVAEVEQDKKTCKINIPIQVSIAIYQLAKLRVLEFYYDCMSKFIDREQWQYVEMDTDSAYIAVGASGERRDKIEALIERSKAYIAEHGEAPKSFTEDVLDVLCKDDMREQWQREKSLWIPTGQAPNPKCSEGERGTIPRRFDSYRDKRTPGLFKTEAIGSAFVGLNS
jgi:hypothetical protein